MQKVDTSIMSRIKSAYIILIIIFAVDRTYGKGGLCQTPGICVPLSACRTITDLINGYKSLPYWLKNVVAQSSCGKFNNVYHVCCDPKDVIDRLLPVRTRAGTVRSKHDVRTGLSLLQKQSNYCGMRDADRVTKLSEFPWMALLIYSNGLIGCGGTLIHERYVLTAAHCILSKKNNLVRVRLGEYDTKSDKDCEGGGYTIRCAPPTQEIDIKEAIYHKDFNPPAYSDDIGLLRLVKKAVITTNVIPICLPITYSSMTYSIDKMIIAGWGVTNNGSEASILQYADVPVISFDDCRKIYTLLNITHKHICAGGGQNLINTCKGDSGGPLFNYGIYNWDVWRFIQFGVISAGTGVCGSNEPGIHSKIEEYLDWITSNLTEDYEHNVDESVEEDNENNSNESVVEDYEHNFDESFGKVRVLSICQYQCKDYFLNMQKFTAMSNIKNMYTTLILILTVIFAVDRTYGDGALCQTPGICVPLSACRTITDLINGYKSLPYWLKNVVAQSSCGKFNNVYHVCCDPKDVIDRLLPVRTRAGTVRSKHDVRTGLSLLQKQSNYCGMRDADRVTKLSEFPWMALLIYSNGLIGCGGTLIHERYVLTAAHCILSKKNKLVRVRLGEYDTKSDKDCEGEGDEMRCAPPTQEIDIKEAIYHKDFNPTAYSNDIGLLRLARKAVIATNVIPICLPITYSSRAYSYDKMIIAGWGVTDNGSEASILQYAYVPVISFDDCRKIYTLLNITHKHICAGGGQFVFNSCRVDSGGPLFNYGPNKWGDWRFIQFGVISAGAAVCGSNEPGIYTNVKEYLDWITSNLTEDYEHNVDEAYEEGYENNSDKSVEEDDEKGGEI
ncbi:uncharacterized protein LOC129909543 [Episyrphus balteatus]|uniref:uncharacterized protein LOC129909543 n=1 Tax=Episyrphus balteatus TaxID=286459 RepID=UPI00248540EC|nr:uncharacterized protein LOC129909543 [Episyrphus balteatus]